MHLLFLGFILFFSADSRASSVEIFYKYAKVRLIAPTQISTEPQVTFGVHFELAPGWHIYWKNSGDSGAPPKFALAGNATLQTIGWPVPERIAVGDLVNFGYSQEVLFPLTVQRADKQTPLQIKLDLEWLVCKV